MDERLSVERALAGLPRAVLSHESAARELGIELLGDDGRCRLTVPRNHGRVVRQGWLVHRADVPDADLAPGMPRTTGAARTLVDLSRALPLSSAVAAADSALRLRLLSLEEAAARLRGVSGRGAAKPRRVAELLDVRCGSVLESALRVLLAEAGLPPPQTQYVIRAGRAFAARVDFCWPGYSLVVEAGGFEFHSDRAAYRADRRRLNQIESLGWRVLRFSWEDVMHRPAYVVALVRECLRLARAA